jgi:mRNA interferase MazF
MKSGDIVLIRFPQADLKAGKLRPALVIAVAPGTHPDLLLALITSRTYQAVPDFDELIAESDGDYDITTFIRLAKGVGVVLQDLK